MCCVGSAAGRAHFPRNSRCALCMGEHRTDRHKCPVGGCSGKKGQTCAHMVTKCVNCRGTMPLMPSDEGDQAGSRGRRSPTRYRVTGGDTSASSPPPEAAATGDERDGAELEAGHASALQLEDGEIGGYGRISLKRNDNKGTVPHSFVENCRANWGKKVPVLKHQQ